MSIPLSSKFELFSVPCASYMPYFSTEPISITRSEHIITQPVKLDLTYWPVTPIKSVMNKIAKSVPHCPANQIIRLVPNVHT